MPTAAKALFIIVGSAVSTHRITSNTIYETRGVKKKMSMTKKKQDNFHSLKTVVIIRIHQRESSGRYLKFLSTLLKAKIFRIFIL